MERQARSSDMGLGLAFVLGVVATVGALASTFASYLYSLGGEGNLLLISGIGIAVAMGAGGLTIAVMHVYEI
ncbi:MAG: hypothetical protein ABEH56_04825 [Salinirussus sp.]